MKDLIHSLILSQKQTSHFAFKKNWTWLISAWILCKKKIRF